MQKGIFFRCVAIICCLVLYIRPLALAGGDPPVLKVLRGAQIHADSVITVEDSKFFDAGYNSILVKPYPVKSKITFRINEDANVLLRSAFTASVVLRITYTYADNSTYTEDKYFEVQYNPGGSYNATVSYPFEGVYRVRVEVLSASANVGWNVWEALSVEAEMVSMPVYQFSCTTDTIQTISYGALDPGTDADELAVSWPNKIKADEYDLEWTYVDSSALSAGTYGDSASPSPALIFDNNATRVTITGTSYKIPLVYDNKGTLFFRVRVAQLKADGSRYEANWSSDNSSGLGRFLYNGHQRNLNWQATTSFAEEGKRKTVVQYYDGSLRARQTVTKDNTTHTTIVSESYYDYQGRPVIQVLPAPTIGTIIKYSQNFNTGLNGNAYDKPDFDSLYSPSLYCGAGAAAMSTDSGAARYYSASNSLKDSGFHRFIPDAGGYPFTETAYTQDNTGRISRQGGVGPAHQLGSGHETSYFYGTPDQHELDALFGTEAGDHSHYYKTMVRDANGQYSVSYTDMHGRTIATALAGDVPDSIHLDKLSSYDSAHVTVSLSDASTNVIKDLVMESSKGLLVEQAGWHTFTYQLSPESLQLPGCDSTPVCYDCLYDLEIAITDDCNNQKLGGQAFDTTLHNFSVIDTTCAAGAVGFTVSFSKYLVPGSYDITKRLAVSRYGKDYYRDSLYLKKNTCNTADSFINAQRAIQAAVEMCKPACAHCADSLGTQEQFGTRFKQHTGIDSGDTSYNGLIAQAYAEALDNCNQLCDKTSEYDDIRKAMLLDMTPPSGQYANPDIKTDPRSIFYAQVAESPNTDTIPDFIKPTDYKDEYGNPDKVYDEDVDALVSPQQLSMEAFVRKFKLSWAEALLYGHPEYCKLQKYEALKASLEWDRRFEATDTYADAMKKGYLNPTHNSGAPFNKYNATETADIDPILSLSGHDYTSELETELQVYRGNTINGGISMWSMANLSTLCKDNSTPACLTTYTTEANVFDPSKCAGDLDVAWRAFRQLYQDIKREKINTQLKTSPCGSVPAAATLLAEGHQPHFGDAVEMMSATGIPNPSDMTQASAMQAQGQAVVDSSYNANCRAYVTQWLQQLAPCNYTSVDTAVIMPLLVQVCREGSDLNHPYGASSVKPTSTNSYKSFEDVINAYNASHGITNVTACNAYLITAPKPYDRQLVYSAKPVWTRPNECECAQITRLHDSYLQVSGSYSSFSQYLLQVYQTTLTDSVANLLLSLCSSTTPSPCSYLATPVYLPGAMQCNTGDVCADCSVIGSLYDNYKTTYLNAWPAYTDSTTDSAQLARNTLFENYMNNHLGYSKQAYDYLAFIDTCYAHAASTTHCDSLAQIKNDYVRYNGHIPHLDASGADTTFFKVDFGGVYYTLGVPLGQVIGNGVFHIPESYAATIPSNYKNVDIDHFNDTLCIDTSGFTYEMRIKMPDSVHDGRGIDSAFFWFNLKPNKAAGQVQVAVTPHALVLITHITDPLGSYVYIPHHFDFNDWRVFKLKVRGRHIYTSVDDSVSVDMPLTDPMDTIKNWSSNVFSFGASLDYIRIYDTSGRMYYDEEFSDAHNLGYSTPAANCQVCDTRFATYYNLRRGTAYTPGQVDSLYATGCGVAASPCAAGIGNCSQTSSFIKTLGGTGTDVLADVKKTPDGGYITAGRTTSFGASGTDGYIIKTDAAGLVQWSKTYGKQWSDELNSIQPTADGGYVATGTINADENDLTGDIWVLKIDAYGNKQWSKQISAGTTNGESGVKIIQTTDKGYALTAYYDFAPSYADVLVIKLDSAGNQVWNKHLNTDNTDLPSGLVEAGDSLVVGAVCISSTMAHGSTYYDGVLMKISQANGNIGWAHSYDIDSKSNWFFDLFHTTGGYTILSSLADDYPGSNQYANVVQVSDNGTSATSFKVDYPRAGSYTGGMWVTPTSDGGLLTVESENGGGDVYLQKSTLSGTPLWTNRIKIDGSQLAYNAVQNTDGTFTVMGLSDGHGLLLKTDTLGRGNCSDSSLTISNTAATITTYSHTYSVHDSVSLSYNDVDSIGVAVVSSQSTVCVHNYCALPLTGPTLCGRAAPVFPPVSVDAVDNCSDSTFFAVSKGTELYNAYRDSLIHHFDSSYRSKCMQAYKLENFTVTRTVSQYHYTLYYYDQAGNLVKTIAPAGVRANYDSLWLDSVKTARAARMLKVPAHIMPTQYRYNTLNQLVAQQTPDAGLSQFWYDRLGRLALSQNARQNAYSAARQYSYTQYDWLGRISEVGQINDTTATGAMTDSISRNESLLGNWLLGLTNKKEQVTRTVYDQEYPGVGTIPLSAVNLRNRVAYTTYTHGNSASNYNQGTFYSYDIHGNVDTLLQDYGSSLFGSTVNIMNDNSARWKRITYQYDLISGKVNMVMYNTPYWDITTGSTTNPADVFYHRYSYDAENRLTLTETSQDSVIWEKDARYEYYKHGPLARTVLGEQQVQGLDYAYTIQGWLKGMNSTSLRSVYDMGEDGKSAGAHQYTAKDAVGFDLNYFNNDYAPIKNTVTPFANAAALGSSARPLYNGNISSMGVNIGAFNQPYLYKYSYDQLNRLTGQDAYTGLDTTTNSWSGLAHTDAWKERVSYDANGNIQRYDRHWYYNDPIMDSLTYHYETGTNKLLYVSEANTSYASVHGSDDIEDQPSGNYAYDEIGNLIKDSSENIPLGGIKWNVYGKITEISRTAATATSNTRQVQYSYDAAGNRVGKKANYFGNTHVDYTWYVRDAQGNTLQVYTAGRDTSGGMALSDFDLLLSESYIFGSSRVGQVYRNSYAEYNFGGGTKYGGRGNKFYEISNHLGNVLSVISDKKYGIADPLDTTKVGWYNPDIIKASDYYPFGMISRVGYYGSNDYRYGFNGKENDRDVKGDGNQIDYEKRIYDPRLGRFLSQDPLIDKYPWYTPYQFAGNSPIANIDLDGEEEEWYKLKIDKETGKPQLTLVKKTTEQSILWGAITWENDHIATHVEYNGQTYSFNLKGHETGSPYIEQLFNEFTQDPDGALAKYSTALTSDEQEFKGFVSDAGIAVGASTIGTYVSYGRSSKSVTTPKSQESGAEPLPTQQAKPASQQKAATNIEAAPEPQPSISSTQIKKVNRTGDQAKLKAIGEDTKASSADKGWIRQEVNQINRKTRTAIRRPPGKVLAHERGREAAKGYSYEHSNLQTKELHKLQHKYDKNGTLNKERQVQ